MCCVWLGVYINIVQNLHMVQIVNVSIIVSFGPLVHVIQNLLDGTCM